MMTFHVLRRVLRRCAELVLGASFLSTLFAQSPGEFTVSDSQTQSIADTWVFSGEAFPLQIGDLAYESPSQRNALVIYGGGALRLLDHAVVSVVNSNNTAFLRVGYGTAGSLEINAGASLEIGSAERYANFHIGQGVGATGTVNQLGGTVTTIGSFNLGVNGGTGVYSISDGSLIFDHAGPAAGNRTTLISIGFNNSASGTSSGTLNINGGLVELKAVQPRGAGEADPVIGFIIGNRSMDALAAYGGGAAGAGNGVVDQTAGVFRVGAGASLYLSGYGNGVYNLKGGRLEIGGNSLQAQYGNHAQYSYAFNLGGGTIQVNGSDLITSVDINVFDRKDASKVTQSFIDTNGLNATFSGKLTGDGELVKTGLGVLTLSGDNSLTGAAYVVGGSIRQTAGDSTIKYMGVGSGAGTNGTYDMVGGTLNIAGESSVALQVGDWGGTGVFNQTGGTVNVSSSFNVGNQGGTGVYNLSAGTLNLTNGLYSIGRNAGGNPASTGTFNLSGTGLLNISAGNFVIGNRDHTAASNGSGTFTQTGGTLRVTGTSGFYLSGYGDGVYNLNGGTLEIGGTAFNGRYGSSTTSTYAFNFGGGTIRALDSDFSTGVNATLVAQTLSTFDTDGHDAKWTGRFTGAGGLRKTGDGKLTLSGANNFGGLLVDEGSATNGTGTTTVGVLNVGGTGVDGGVFDLTGGVVNVVQGNPLRGEITVGGGTDVNGTLNITGGQLNVGDAGSFSRFFVGAYDGTGVVNQSGGTVNTTGPFHLGNRGGHGTYHLSAGLLNVGQFPAADDSNAFILGRSRTGQQTNVSRGYLEVSGTGALVLNDNTPLLVGGDAGSTAALSEGYVTQTGGKVTVNSWIDLGSNGYGEYNLTGGTLEIGGTNGLRSTSENYVFNFGNATIKAINTAFTTNLNFKLATGALATINTNGVGATFSGNFDGAQSGLVKVGDDVLTLSGAVTRNFYYFNAYEGSTVQTDGVTNVAEFVVGSNYVTNDGSFTLSGGTLKIADAVTGTGSMRVGDFGGTGVFTQTGGVVQVGSATETAALNIGNQGGDGTYNLDGGTLNLAGGMNVIGRSFDLNPASTGTLNIRGEDTLLEISNGSSLIVGNNADRAAYGTGTINQSGGTVRVTDGVLFVAGYGNGTYNLTGGTLEVGGNSLRARYNNNLSTSTFNFGGGTIKVIGSALKTDVVPNLVANTTSAIDTNNYDATFTGGFTGAGGFSKIGANALILGGTTSLHYASSQVGVVSIGGEGASTGTLNLDEGTYTIHSTGGVKSTLAIGNGLGTNGTLNIKSDVNVIADANGPSANVRIGTNGGTGSGTMTAGTVTITSGAGSYGTFDVGAFGDDSNGTFTQTGGLIDVGGGAFQVGVSGGDGTYNLGGDAVITLGSGSSVFIGNDSAISSGWLNITGSAKFLQGSANSTGSQFWLGAKGANGHVVQDGAATEVSIVTDNRVFIGVDAGTGVYDLKSGALLIGGTHGISLGHDAGSAGTLSQSGGELTTIGSLVVGGVGTGEFNLSGGTATLDGPLVVAEGAGSTGRVNLTGGVLEVGGANGIKSGAGSSAFSLGGGTLRVKGSTLTTAVNASLVGGSSFKVDTNGLGAVFSGSLTGSGGLTKTGAGTLQLTGSSNYSGDTLVESGTFQVDGILSNTQVRVGRGAVLAGHGTVFGVHVLDGGSISLGDTPGSFAVTGDLTLDQGSHTLLRIADLLNYDSIEVAGILFANGVLEVRLVEGFNPLDGASFRLFDAADFQGRFESIELTALAEGLEWNLDDLYSSGVVSVQTSAVPEPATLAVLFGVVALTAGLGRRRRR